ncbi:MAG TPA: leucyl aminopeptidase [Micromonosporaceae bacterium]|jgi:leucyl aminopeptidase
MMPAIEDPSALTPSAVRSTTVTVGTDAPDVVTGVPVSLTGDVPDGLGIDREALTSCGFTGEVGQVLPLPAMKRAAVGIGDVTQLQPGTVRDAAAAFAGAASAQARLAFVLPAGSEAVTSAQAAVEGVLLGRYRYEALKRAPQATPIAELTIVAAPDQLDDATEGAERGHAYASATILARDLANSPPGLLTAVRFGEIATRIGAETGLDVDVYDKGALIEMGCGGLLGVNAGSADPPVMIKLTYTPEEAPAGHLSLVGKGIMYDSGGISLKPGDEVHATMKNDMSGAGAILAAMSLLTALNCPIAVTGFLMCTDNMPSGTAIKLGDVLSIRGGTTVEVLNTDAEGRLVMADALVLANEAPTDAIVDIATLTGACLRALGPDVAGVFGTDQGLVDQVLAAAGATGEPAWQLPLDRRYRKWLNSDVADIKNVGGSTAGAITAALFLAEFAGTTPWAHIDIAGTAWNDVPTSWRPTGCTGFGARMILDLAMTFSPDEVGADRPSVATYALTGVS